MPQTRRRRKPRICRRPWRTHWQAATILPHLEYESIFINDKRAIVKAMC